MPVVRRAPRVTKRGPTDEERVQRAFVERFAEALRNARTVRGHTQAELSRRVGIAANTLARIERAELCPSVFIASKLADALAVTLESLTKPRKEAPPLVRRKGG